VGYGRIMKIHFVNKDVLEIKDWKYQQTNSYPDNIIFVIGNGGIVYTINMDKVLYIEENE
jgi:hypothetical protein